MTKGPEFRSLDGVTYGRVDRVSPMIRRVVAENPSKFTYLGTGTYIVGHGEVAVVDPGPLLDSHRDALSAALAGERVTAIVVTHCHSDHSPLAAWLREQTNAPTYAFGPHPRPGADDADDDLAGDVPTGDPPGEVESRRSEVDGRTRHAGEERACGGRVKVEETTDYAFSPDVAVADGDTVATGPGWTLRGVHTPGHTSNHMCVAFAEEGVLFPGDHVMGWSTTVVSPPDGDMAAYINSLRKVAGRDDRTYWPTHGPSIDAPQRYLQQLVEHRLQRERQVLDAVRSGLGEVPAIVARLYAGVAEELHKPAGRTVLAHLVKLVDEGHLAVSGGATPRLSSRYTST